MFWEYALGGARFQCVLQEHQLMVLKGEVVLFRETVSDYAAARELSEQLHGQYLREILASIGPDDEEPPSRGS